MKTTTAHITIPNARRWAGLAVLCTAQFMVIMDTSIIGVALPAIQKDLGYSDSGLQWIFNAYVIFLGGLLLLGGKLSDLFGPRKIFMAGFAVLTAASLLAGLAWSEASMNVARALQGAGSALIAPAALSLLMSTFTDPAELGKAFGFWGASAAAGGSAGVFLGGLLTEWLSWHWTFLINIPMGLAVLALSKTYLVKGMTQKGRLDLPGAVTATAALVLLVSGIVSAESAGWESPLIMLLLGGAVALFALFLLIQRRSADPMLPLSVFRIPNLATGNLVMLLLAGAWIPLWFFLNIYLQKVLLLPAFKSGLALLPMTIVIMIMMTTVTGKVIARLGVKGTLISGLALLVGALVLFSFADEHGSFLADVLPASLLGAAGMSLAYIPGTMISLSGAKPEESGLASGLVNTSYQVGSALGLAVIVAVFSGTVALNNHLTKAISVSFLVTALIAAVAFLIALLKIKSAPRS